MMARFGRRRNEPADEELDEEEWPGEEAPPARTSVTRRASTAAPEPPVDDLPSSRLRGNEITYGYVVGGIVALAGVIMLVITTGKGAPTHHQPIWAALAVVFGVATMLTIRLSNRMLTALVAIAGGFVSGQAKTPDSLSGVKIVALLTPVIYGIMVFRRQSKADRALRAQRPRQSAAERKAARSGGRRGAKVDAKDGPLPGRPAPSGRYTPPQKKERRTR